MQQKNMFKCDFCDFECSDSVEMAKHEAAHLGLTVEEHNEYRSKQQFYAFVKNRYEENKDKVSEELLKEMTNNIDSTKQELNSFEVAHGLNITE